MRHFSKPVLQSALQKKNNENKDIRIKSTKQIPIKHIQDKKKCAAYKTIKCQTWNIYKSFKVNQ